MDNLFQTSLFAGVTVSLVAYLLGMLLKKKFKLAILNPLLISIPAPNIQCIKFCTIPKIYIGYT